MMRRSWLVLTLLAAVFLGPIDQVWAQRVHLLAAGDTLDPAIGEGVEQDIGNIVLTFFFLLREGQLEHDRIVAEELSAENILKRIEGIRLQPDDALVFYWAGHGAYDNDGHYLQMPRGGNLYRSTLLGALKKKGARLTVLLSDCCNVFSDSTAGKPAVSPASPDPNRPTSPLFDELFIQSRGVVDINAAAQGEVALGTKEGGLFTLSLAYMMPGRDLEEGEDFSFDKSFGVFWRYSDQRVPWQTIVQESRREVQELFSQMNPDGLIARDGKVYHKQTVAALSLPEEKKAQPQDNRGSRFGVEAVENRGEGVKVTRVWNGYPGKKVVETRTNRTLQLQRGDVILTINGRKISSVKDYWDAVKNSPATMQMTVRDVNDGTVRELKTKLRY